ncbi:hypothetical protein EVAR_64582_1 [Eumeta japonica]|uniref:Uncharacterized protein n=1 Tax=Eumeta variegata TaxID=151549 RepID=A0A4C1ZI08_EUMVA|nr:hypothetical protein EVAR_64582_1 [Eumeta japonica]
MSNRSRNLETAHETNLFALGYENKVANITLDINDRENCATEVIDGYPHTDRLSRHKFNEDWPTWLRIRPSRSGEAGHIVRSTSTAGKERHETEIAARCGAPLRPPARADNRVKVAGAPSDL